MELTDSSHPRPDRKDLRRLEAVIWIATNAMDGIGESLVADPPHRHRLQYEESTVYPRGRRVTLRRGGNSLWAPMPHQTQRSTNDILE